MTEDKQYKCVNCGAQAAALYRTYGPTVIKLSKCERCKEIVDKYIEYDPVIVMIDLVLMSKEAQRHVLYNSEFKSYLKLLIILIMVETYGVWHNNSLFNTVTNTLCGIHSTNGTDLSAVLNITLPESWNNSCWAWTNDEKADNSDLFIWEKDFYVQFISIFTGIAVFIATIHILMKIMRLFFKQNEVRISRLVKAFSLANVSVLLTLPVLVWGAAGAEPEPHSTAVHHLLVFLYSYFVFLNVFTVLYECPVVVTALLLVVSHISKFATSFHATPRLRTLVS